MRAAEFNPTKVNQAIEILDSLYRHRLESPLLKTDAMYYKLVGNWFRQIRDARDQGRLIVHKSSKMPCEIIYAMGGLPLWMESTTAILLTLTNSLEEGLASTKSVGFAPELCSMAREVIAVALNGWLPRPDAIVWGGGYCDTAAKRSDVNAYIYDCPHYLIDRIYKTNEREIAHFTHELEGLVSFLEQVSGRKMDYDRLTEVVAYGKQMVELEREIEELRRATPAPMRGRLGMQVHVIGMLYMGTPEGVEFFRQMRDDARANVEKGAGAIKEEKYRLVMYMEPPLFAYKLLDWMERAHGAIIVADPCFSHWAPGDIDPTKPIQALAKKTFLQSGNRQWWGPAGPLLEDMVEAVQKGNADAVLSFCSVTCTHSSSLNRMLKDKLMEEAGVPFFYVEDDVCDPAFVSEEEIRDKIEGFLEIIDERRG